MTDHGGSFEWRVETNFEVSQRITLEPKDGKQFYDSKPLLDTRLKEIELSLRFGYAADDEDDAPELIKLGVSGFHMKKDETDKAYHVHVQAFLSRDTAQQMWLALNTILNWKGL